MKQHDFNTLILPLRDTMLRVALAITHNEEEAEDIVQDTMMKLWLKREQWSEIDNLQAYCMTACRHLAIDNAKSKRHLAQPLDTQLEAASHEPSSQQHLEANELKAAIEIAYAALPPLQQKIIALREHDEMSYDEIADTLSISMSQVKVYLMRARTRLRKTVDSLSGK